MANPQPGDSPDFHQDIRSSLDSTDFLNMGEQWRRQKYGHDGHA